MKIHSIHRSLNVGLEDGQVSVELQPLEDDIWPFAGEVDLDVAEALLRTSSKDFAVVETEESEPPHHGEFIPDVLTEEKSTKKGKKNG